MKRARVLIAAAALAAVAVGVVLLAGGSQPSRAQAACDRAARFQDQVTRNAEAEAVFATLADAIVEARAATGTDPGQRPLLSGLEAVRYALENDDADAARTGIDVVRAHCEEGR